MTKDDDVRDDGTRPSRIWPSRFRRDRGDRGRGAGQTHGASNSTGVDAAPDGAENPDATAAPPSAGHERT